MQKSKIKFLSVIAVAALVVLVATVATTQATTIGTNVSTGGDLTTTAGNLTIGNGTPSVTLNGEDAYIEGTFEVDGVSRFDGVSTFGGAISPVANDGSALGAVTTGEWSDLFLASGGVVNWNNGDVTLTHATNGLTLGGGNLTITQPVFTSGSPTGLTFTGGAHTTLTAGTEASDVNFNLARTVQFATGTLTTQRAFLIQANPTYDFVGASALTTAHGVQISGMPQPGPNATFNTVIGFSNFPGSAGAVSGTGNAIFGAAFRLPGINNSVAAVTNLYAIQVGSGGTSVNLGDQTSTITSLSLLNTSTQTLTSTTNTRTVTTASGISTGAPTVGTGTPPNIVGTNVTIANAYAGIFGRATAQVSQTALNYAGIIVPAHTLSLIGTTQMTNAPSVTGINVGQITLTDSSALTVNSAASVYIANAPVQAGSVTLTNSYSLWVDAGTSRFDGSQIINGTQAIAPTATGTITDYQLGTATWTTGTLINADFDGATTLTGTVSGINLDFFNSINADAAGGLLLTGYSVTLPTVSNAQTATYTYTGHLVSGNTLSQTQNAPTTTWMGYAVGMPTATRTMGALGVYGVKVTGASSSGFDNVNNFYSGMDITMNAMGDVALRVGKGLSIFKDGHLRSTQTTAPTSTLTSTTLNDGGGSGALITVTSGSTDTAGSFTVKAGNGTPTAGIAGQIVFNSAYSLEPKMVLFTSKDGDGINNGIQVGPVNTSSFTIIFNTALSISEEVEFYYHVIE